MRAFFLILLLAPAARAWNFAVSGDSRDCGDVVMPAIAAGARKDGALFYWHLGDLRRIYGVDADIAHQPEHLKNPPTLEQYLPMAWDDFIDSQLKPFGKLTVYVGIGNHETIPPKTRAEFDAKFWPWRPGGKGTPGYYRWTKENVDFINLDNATTDQFDAAQTAWFKKTLESDKTDPKIKTVVVGMHEALPESLSANHSMDESSADGAENGRAVYRDLLAARAAGKRVYVLASHSHLYIKGVFNTDYWRKNGGVLPGWIVGTAGAERYALPEGWKQADEAKTRVYGYLLGSVNKNGAVDFRFKQLQESDIPAPVAGRYGAAFVHWCFEDNMARWKLPKYANPH